MRKVAQPRALRRRSSSLRRSATEAVVAGRDLAIVDLVRIDIPEKKWSTIHPLHVELLIKIAVVNLAPPSDANGVSAHEPVNRCWVKRIYQHSMYS